MNYLRKTDVAVKSNIVTIFMLLAGAVYFLYYILASKNYLYIALVIVIYIFGFVSRTFILRVGDDSGVTEPGLFLLTSVLLAYILYLFKLDPDILNYLPEKLIIVSAPYYVFLLMIGMISDSNKLLKKFLILFLLGSLLFLNPYEKSIEIFLLSNPWVTYIVFGCPVLYIIFLTFGISFQTFFKNK
jgi:hypothetical protein